MFNELYEILSSNTNTQHIIFWLHEDWSWDKCRHIHNLHVNVIRESHDIEYVCICLHWRGNSVVDYERGRQVHYLYSWIPSSGCHLHTKCHMQECTMLSGGSCLPGHSHPHPLVCFTLFRNIEFHANFTRFGSETPRPLNPGYALDMVNNCRT